MKLFSRSTGAGISALGALLVLLGTFLPTYGSGDYEGTGLHNAPLLVLALLVAPTLLILASSVIAWFRHLPIWLIVVSLVIAVLALILHVFVSGLFTAFACFDVCPPGGVHFGTGFWLPLAGFPLAIIGIVVVAATQKRLSPSIPPATSA